MDGIVNIHGKDRKLTPHPTGYLVLHSIGGRGGRNTYAHRIVAENALGRRLKKTEEVHHVDGNKANNDPSNLVICNRAYHMYLHSRQRAQDATGDANAIKCEYCREYGAEKKRANRNSGWHFECKRIYERAAHKRRKSNV